MGSLRHQHFIAPQAESPTSAACLRLLEQRAGIWKWFVSVREGPTSPEAHQLMVALMEIRAGLLPPCSALCRRPFCKVIYMKRQRRLETGAVRMENIPEAWGATWLVERAAGLREI